MTPRERGIEALELRRPPGPVPSCELAFNLFSEWLGRPAPSLRGLEDLDRDEQLRRLREFAPVAAEVFRQMDHCIITFWADGENMADMLRTFRETVGDEFLLGFPADPTYGIPGGKNMLEYCWAFADRPAEMHDRAKRQVDEGLAVARRMRDAGGDTVWMGSDYAMNSGPFFSPDMFAEFVAPYLKQVVSGFREMGIYVIKHTDGNINPILDQIVDARPHAIHSLDTVAGVDIREVKEQYGDHVALIGNIPHGPLQQCRKDEIEEAARYCLTYGGVEQGGYIYASSNAVFSNPGTEVGIDAYRFMLSVRDRFMAELRPQGKA